MTGAVVRRIGPDEADAWRAIRLAALKDTPGAFAARFEDWATLPIADFVAQTLATPVFIAFDGSTPVGSAVWTDDRERAERAWLEALYLAPTVRGRGLGQALIAAAMSDAARAGKSEMWLEVATGSTAAQAAYRRAGFELADLPPARRRCGADDLAMRCPLSQGASRQFGTDDRPPA